MVKARSDKARVSVTDLTRIGRKPATIKASEITITPSVIQDAGPAYVTLEADTTDVPTGLYEGALVAGAGGKEAPALFFVSHAQPVRVVGEPTCDLARGTAGRVGRRPPVAAHQPPPGLHGRRRVYRSVGPRGRVR